MRKHHIELPAVVAAVRSVGVVTTNSGDLKTGEGLNRRTVCVAAAGRVSVGVGGKGIAWTGFRDIEERISMTGDGTNAEAAVEEEPDTCDTGTDPGGRMANT